MKYIIYLSYLFCMTFCSQHQPKVCIDFTEGDIEESLSQALDKKIPQWEEKYNLDNMFFLSTYDIEILPSNKTIKYKLDIQIDMCSLNIIKISQTEIQ